MPIYTYLCPLCGEVDNVWGHIGEDRKIHEDCGRTMTRLVSLSNITPVMHEHIDGNMGHEPVVVKGRVHHRQLLRERGLSER
jgi:hypothetical protein